MIGISNLYVGTLTDDPTRAATSGVPVAQLTLRCSGGDDGGEVALAVSATDELAEVILRDLHRGDDVLVVGGLVAPPPGVATACVAATHIGLDLGAARRHDAASPMLAGASAVAPYHPEYQW